MIGCLILSHGDVAQAYLDAVRQIIGECEHVYAMNCQHLTPKLLYDEIAHLLDSKDLEDGLFIFVSLRGGTCWNVAARIANQYGKVEVLSGINLSIVLSFVSKRDHYRFEEFGEVLLADGMRAISRSKHK
ncbi:PTS sugar transporter subunit IIA [candidate division KSB1 bacterium]|nr:PTS sugar transporter subunit IIA [candidate division KSB1 bacterium]NIR73137.1 PTS sugar transporter subunit IIA [candidate division KSB1 bacterium]NIS25211.1 PTS sugar transporter subunit IIA [candidate division KSB1 bacterium]NIT72120.1 PTS sugar transporter subunit IIA [candidate division KSB1 bacterium]NIU25925.1 PTS sugar transporter subunit IIA [candidate division KSB1 bacterium]